MTDRVGSYRDILKDDKSLAIFLRNMAKFDRHFCEMMATGVDFTIRLEVQGEKGKLSHCRVYSDGFDRPEIAGRQNAIGRNRDRH